jgi:hypothetical protein
LCPGVRAIFYAHGDITASGSSFSNNGAAANLQVYKYGSGKVTLSGSSSYNAFIFAPFSQTIQSGTGTVRGAIWTQSWSKSGGAGVTQMPIDFSQLKININTSTNAIGRVLSWVRQSV